MGGRWFVELTRLCWEYEMTGCALESTVEKMRGYASPRCSTRKLYCFGSYMAGVSHESMSHTPHLYRDRKSNFRG